MRIGFWRLRARLVGRLPVRGQDRGSMTMALLVGLIGSGIAAMLLPMLVVQIGSTSFDNSRTREMNAAESGTLFAVGLVRSAVGDQGQGVVSQLPCTSTPLTGTVDGSAGNLTYRVQIGYYTQNPTDQPDSWLATYTGASGAGHGMRCSQSAGTYLPAGALGSADAQRVPSWAVITSTGVDGRGERTLRSIYTVKTSNANIAGGTIYLWTSSTTQYCMDAGSSTPNVGDQVHLQPCATDAGGNAQLVQKQAWAYNSDLSIELVSSVSSAHPHGLCLSAADVNDTSGQSANDKVVLAECSDIGSAPWNQMWSVDDSAHLEGSTTTKSDTNGLCINAASQGANVPLTLQTCAGGTTDPKQTWVPSPDAGAGMAGANGHTSPVDQTDSQPIQYVNFLAFSHCMDVTNQDPTSAFLIAYTCKQNPSPSKVAWNQKFQFNSAGQVITHDTTNGNYYCLTSPGSVYSSPSTGPWVNVTQCSPGSATTSTTWTKFGASDASGDPLNATDKYKIKDSSGACLSITSASAAAYNGYPKLITETCSGDGQNAKRQMWNGSPDVQTPQLTDFSEVDRPVSP